MSLPSGKDRTPFVDVQEARGEAALHKTIDLPVCRKLRTKMAFSAMVTPDGEALRWQRGDGSTATYWCLVTMECAGPDDGLAHAHECREGRGCYFAPESPR
jgi:hypothetical protein